MGLRSEKGTSYGGVIPLFFLLTATPVVGIAAFVLGRRVYAYYQLPAEERDALPWWPREYLAGGLLLTGGSFLTLLVAFYFTYLAPLRNDAPGARLLSIALFSALFGPLLYFLIATPAALVWWRRRLREPSLWKIWALNLGLIFFAMVYLAIGYGYIHR